MSDNNDLLLRLRRTSNDWQNPEQELLNRAAGQLEFDGGMIEQADRQIAGLREVQATLYERIERLEINNDALEADNAALRKLVQQAHEHTAKCGIISCNNLYRKIDAALLAGKEGVA